MLSILLRPRGLPGLLVARYEHSRALERDARRDKGLAGALRAVAAPEGDGAFRLARRSGVTQPASSVAARSGARSLCAR
jgi:hypothetical protein